jgi:hypothetical protein
MAGLRRRWPRLIGASQGGLQGRALPDAALPPLDDIPESGSDGRRGTHAQYERLLEAGLALAAELSLPAALQRIVELAAELTGARYGALGCWVATGPSVSSSPPG